MRLARLFVLSAAVVFATVTAQEAGVHESGDAPAVDSSASASHEPPTARPTSAPTEPPTTTSVRPSPMSTPTMTQTPAPIPTAVPTTPQLSKPASTTPVPTPTRPFPVPTPLTTSPEPTTSLPVIGPTPSPTSGPALTGTPSPTPTQPPAPSPAPSPAPLPTAPPVPIPPSPTPSPTGQPMPTPPSPMPTSPPQPIPTPPSPPQPTPPSPTPSPTSPPQPIPSPPSPSPTSPPEPTSKPPSPPQPTPTPPSPPEPTPPSPTPSPTPPPEPTPTPTPTSPLPSPPDPTPSPLPIPAPDPAPSPPLPTLSPPKVPSPVPTPSPTEPGSPTPPPQFLVPTPLPTPSAPTTPSPSTPDPEEDLDELESSTPPPRYPLSSQPPPSVQPLTAKPNTTASPAPTQGSQVSSSPTTSLPTTSPPTSAPSPKRYQRGDDVIVVQKIENNTVVDVEVVVGPSQSPAVVVRDPDAASPTTAGDSASTAADAERVYDFLRYLSTALAVVSLLMLIFFSFAALATRWFVQPMSYSATLFQPNQWELLVFITYLQALASTAHYLVRGAPVFFWKFVDAFSWTALIPFHKSGSGVSRALGFWRRLTDVVVLDGLVAFADRIGVNEADLLTTTVAGLVFAAIGLFIFFCVAMYFIKLHPKTVDDEIDMRSDIAICSELDFNAELVTYEEDREQWPMLVVYGVFVVVGMFMLHPISLMTTFELASQTRSGKISSGSLTIAILAIFFLVLAFTWRCVTSVAAMDSPSDYKKRLRFRAIWGNLCSSADVKHDQRVVFVASWLAMQVASAIVVGAVQSAVVELSLLLVIDVAYFASIVLLRPYNVMSVWSLPLLFSCSIGLFKMVNTSLAFAFLSLSPSSAPLRHHVATAFIAMNSAILILWFARLFGIACRLARISWDRQSLPRKSTVGSSTLMTHSPISGHPEGSRAAFVAMSSTTRTQ